MAAGNLSLMAEKGERPSPEKHQTKMQERFNEMSERLGLTPDQQAIMKAQRESTMQQMKSIREDDSLTREQKREKMKAIKDSNRDSFSSYLTEDQKQKMQEMKAEREAKREEMGGKKPGPGKGGKGDKPFGPRKGQSEDTE